MAELEVTTTSEPRPKQGLADCGHHVLECSNCAKPLADVMVVLRTPQANKFVARCCYCGDRSVVTEVTGVFAVAGISAPLVDSPGQYRDVTRVANVTEQDGRWVVETARA